MGAPVNHRRLKPKYNPTPNSRERKHHAFVMEQGCLVCGGDAVAHHVLQIRLTSVGGGTIPLSFHCVTLTIGNCTAAEANWNGRKGIASTCPRKPSFTGCNPSMRGFYEKRY